MRDVIVVGAGPAGSRCAARLARYGWDVLMLEARPEIGGKPSCTGLISRACTTEFEIPSDAILRDAGSARLYTPSGDSLYIYRAEPQACVIDRRIFDNYLAGQAVKAGAELRFGHRVTGITAERRSMRVSFNYEGRNAGIEARVIILASKISFELSF